MKMEFVFKNGDRHIRESKNYGTFREFVDMILQSDWAIFDDLAFRVEELAMIRDIRE